MKLVKNLFKWAVVLNVVAYFTALFIVPVFSPSRDVGHLFDAVALASMLVLLALSIASLFLDRRAAAKGLIILLVEFLILCLFPEL
jgi:hypothetical protein